MRRILTGICWIISWSALAQSSWTDQYLLSAYDDPKIRSYAEQSAFLNDNSFRTPLIREIDLRLRTNNLNPAIEEYRLRLDLVNPFVPRADKRYQQAYINYQSIRSNLVINEVLQDRYLDLIQHYWLSQSVTLLEDYKTAIQQLIATAPSLSTREALSINKDLLDLDLNLNELAAEVRQLQLEMQLDETPGWNELELISIDQIRSIIDENLLSGIQEQEALAAEKQLLEEDFNVEKANSRRDLAFIQPEYEADPDKELSNRLGMQIGINIPITKGDKADLGYEKLKLIKAQNELMEEGEELQLLIEVLKNQIDSQFETLAILDDKLETLAEIKENLPLNDWEAVYDYLEYEHLVRKKKLKTLTDLLDSYVQSLTISGRLAAPPKTNYLIKTLPTLE